MSKKGRPAVFQEKINRGDTAELAETVMTKNVARFFRKNRGVTPWVAAPDVTHPSDATGYGRFWCLFLCIFGTCVILFLSFLLSVAVQSVASLGLVSPGAVTSPDFFPKRLSKLHWKVTSNLQKVRQSNQPLYVDSKNALSNIPAHWLSSRKELWLSCRSGCLIHNGI